MIKCPAPLRCIKRPFGFIYCVLWLLMSRYADAFLVTSTIRKRALPSIMRAYASAAFSSGAVSIIGRIFSRTLKASVS